MSNRIWKLLTAIAIVLFLVGFALALTVAVTALIRSDRAQQSEPDLIEAVNMLEEAAANIAADVQEMRVLAARLDCYENQGEWTADHGCSLEVLEP